MKEHNFLFLMGSLVFVISIFLAFNNHILSVILSLNGSIYLIGGMVVEKLDKLIGDRK